MYIVEAHEMLVVLIRLKGKKKEDRKAVLGAGLGLLSIK